MTSWTLVMLVTFLILEAQLSACTVNSQPRGGGAPSESSGKRRGNSTTTTPLLIKRLFGGAATISSKTKELKEKHKDEEVSGVKEMIEADNMVHLRSEDGGGVKTAAVVARGGITYIERNDFVIEELAACILIMIVAYATTALTADRCSRGRNTNGVLSFR